MQRSISLLDTKLLWRKGWADDMGFVILIKSKFPKFVLLLQIDQELSDEKKYLADRPSVCRVDF
jgi:hypothetical protein